MDYFLMKQSGTVTIPKEVQIEDAQMEDVSPTDPSVRITHNLPSLDKFDYLAGEHLVSDNLKLLLEQYLPEQLWRPCVFVDTTAVDQRTFWFLPNLPYVPKRVVAASNGMPAAVYVNPEDFAQKAPAILNIRSAKGKSFLVVHLSVAESMLRRGICGVELVRLSDADAM